MQQKTKLGINFGFRGWMLMIFEITAFLLFQAFTNFPMNMLADMYGGAQKLSTLYTVGTLVGIVFQLILAGKVSKMKSVKPMTLAFGLITLLGALGVMLVHPGTFWLVCYFIVNVFAVMYGMFGIGIIIGEPSGGKPCHYGDVLNDVLPNTNTIVTVSHKYFRRPNIELKDMEHIVPDVHIELNDPDKDLAWEWILENYGK